jgi:hypothetical protein
MPPFPTSLIQNIQFVAFKFLHNYMSNIPHNECNGKKLNMGKTLHAVFNTKVHMMLIVHEIILSIS